MSAIIQRVRAAFQGFRHRRAAVGAAVLLLCAALLFTGSAREAGNALPTLSQLERDGMVLAYNHNTEDLVRMTAAGNDRFVERPFAVTVVADGEEYTVDCYRADLVQDALKKAGVTLGPEDDMSHFPGRPVTPGDRIVVERWTRDTRVSEKPVPYETDYIETSLLPEGRQALANEGQDGLAAQTFDVLLRDGVVMEQTLVSETVVEAPLDQRVLVGEPYAPVSPYDFAWETDASGDPVGYAARLSNQRAAGYSAGPGAGTACGYLPAAVGHVAVNPNVIPYGSKLYIRATDGSFVYGYAIAADTGTGLMQGIIDVDLFYASYEESVFNAIREVEIFILEYPA